MILTAGESPYIEIESHFGEEILKSIYLLVRPCGYFKNVKSIIRIRLSGIKKMIVEFTYSDFNILFVKITFYNSFETWDDVFTFEKWSKHQNELQNEKSTFSPNITEPAKVRGEYK